MAGAVDVLYVKTPGQPLHAGRAPAMPDWWLAAPLNTVVEIPGTIHPMVDGSKFPVTDSYSGFSVTDEGEIITAVVGGHTDGANGEVWSLRTKDNAPAWRKRRNAPDPTPYFQPYFEGGEPAPRHTYWSTFYVPSKRRVFVVGCYSVPGTGNESFPTIDAYNIDTDTWDPPGTYAYLSLTGYEGPVDGVYSKLHGSNQGAMIDADGVVWTVSATMCYDTNTNIVSAGASGDLSGVTRGPWVDSPERGYAFGLCYGDGQGTTVGLGVNAWTRAGSIVTKRTFNASAALTQFIADVPQYAGMDYDPVHDEYWFYEGRGAKAGRFYVITPNGSNAWDMSIRTFPGAAIAASPDSGIVSRFRYVPFLRGFIMLPAKDHGLYFIRTS